MAIKSYVLSIKKVGTIPLIKQLSTYCVLGLGVGHGIIIVSQI